VFAPKFRRREIYGKLKSDIGQILRKLCEQKKVEILEAEACPDHIHMLVSIPPNLGVAQFMGYLKGKSSLMIFDRHANLKYKYGSRHFWCRGYYVDTVGRNRKAKAPLRICYSPGNITEANKLSSTPRMYREYSQYSILAPQNNMRQTVCDLYAFHASKTRKNMARHNTAHLTLEY